MGYDIHLYLEVKNDYGIWNAFGKATTALDENCKITMIYDDCDYVYRNYDVFGVLNGIHVTDEQKQKGTFPVMFPEPRGFPSDLSQGLKDTFAYTEFQMNRYGGETRNTLADLIPSYATYEELKDFVSKIRKTMPKKHYDVNVPFAIDTLFGQINESNFIKYGIPFLGNENHKTEDDILIDEIKWEDISDDKKRAVWYYDW